MADRQDRPWKQLWSVDAPPNMTSYPVGWLRRVKSAQCARIRRQNHSNSISRKYRRGQSKKRMNPKKSDVMQTGMSETLATD